METALAFSCFFVLASFLLPLTHATDFTFSSFQCDPSSCVEQTLPTESGSAFVSFNATCTGGAIGGIEGSALARIGIPEPCSAPFVAKAIVQQSTTTQL